MSFIFSNKFSIKSSRPVFLNKKTLKFIKNLCPIYLKFGPIIKNFREFSRFQPDHWYYENRANIEQKQVGNNRFFKASIKWLNNVNAIVCNEAYINLNQQGRTTAKK